LLVAAVLVTACAGAGTATPHSTVTATGDQNRETGDTGPTDAASFEDADGASRAALDDQRRYVVVVDGGVQSAPGGTFTRMTEEEAVHWLEGQMFCGGVIYLDEDESQKRPGVSQPPSQPTCDRNYWDMDVGADGKQQCNVCYAKHCACTINGVQKRWKCSGVRPPASTRR
jgi:hypothetical protein